MCNDANCTCAKDQVVEGTETTEATAAPATEVVEGTEEVTAAPEETV